MLLYFFPRSQSSRSLENLAPSTQKVWRAPAAQATPRGRSRVEVSLLHPNTNLVGGGGGKRGGGGRWGSQKKRRRRKLISPPLPLLPPPSTNSTPLPPPPPPPPPPSWIRPQLPSRISFVMSLRETETGLPKKPHRAITVEQLRQLAICRRPSFSLRPDRKFSLLPQSLPLSPPLLLLLPSRRNCSLLPKPPGAIWRIPLFLLPLAIPRIDGASQSLLHATGKARSGRRDGGRERRRLNFFLLPSIPRAS